MEPHIVDERHNGLDFTDCGYNHGACYGSDDLFETHLNLQGHLLRCESGVQKISEFDVESKDSDIPFRPQGYTTEVAKASETTIKRGIKAD